MPNIHPLIVHFPIAILAMSALFDHAGVLFKREELNRVGWWSLLAGVVGLLATLTTGLIAEGTVTIPASAQEVFETHEEVAFVVVATFCGLLLWRIASRTNLPAKFRVAYLVLAAAGVLLMFTGAFFGGEMVYRFGVGIR